MRAEDIRGRRNDGGHAVFLFLWAGVTRSAREQRMKLYALTHRRSGAVVAAVKGVFTTVAAGKHGFEVVLSHGNSIELLVTESESGDFKSICRQSVFGNVRSMRAFRLHGGTFDYIVIGTDSGKFTILKFDEANQCFEVVLSHTYGHTGCRRDIAGELLAADPAGRAIMIGALEKQKIVYVMSRDADTPLKIFSPLQANTQHTLTFDIVGVDVGFSHPVFAALELDYTDADEDSSGTAAGSTQKYLSHYELDLGTNSISKTWTQVTDRTANRLISVPGSEHNGPGGVLVLGEGVVMYQKPEHAVLSATLPCREGSLPRKYLIVAHDMHQQKNGTFFFILQSELGDLFKLTLDYNAETAVVASFSIYYFDSIPIANCLRITKNGMLFAANDSGDHFSYVFTGLGGEEGEVVSRTAPSEGEETNARKKQKLSIPTFLPRPLKNLDLCDDSVSSLAPIMGLEIGDFQDSRGNQMYTLCGRGARSTMRVLVPGLSAVELAGSILPGNPLSVWTLRGEKDANHHRYIVLSFLNATLVMEVGEGGSIKELKSSDFTTDQSTVYIGEAGIPSSNSATGFVQILKHQVKHVRGPGRVEEFNFDHESIEHAVCNRRQIAIALQGGIIVYLEMDETGTFRLVTRVNLGESVVCMALEAVPAGRLKTSYLAIGTNAERVGVYALDTSRMMRLVSERTLQAVPKSVSLTRLAGAGSGPKVLTLNVGLRTGFLVRYNVDLTSGTLSGDRENFLGTGQVLLNEVLVGGNPALLTLSPKPHLLYENDSKLCMSNVAYTQLADAAPFASEECPEGFVGIFQNRLSFIASPENLDEAFSQQAISLRYTPRGLCHLALNHQQRENAGTSHALAIIESDCDTAMPANGVESVEELDREQGGYEDFVSPPEFGEMEDGEVTLPDQIGHRRPSSPSTEASSWASCLRVLHPKSGVVLALKHFEPGESAFSIASVTFENQKGESFLIVGTVLGLHPGTTAHIGGRLHVFRLTDSNELELYHTTQVDGMPLAMVAYGGRVLVSIGERLRLYDLGKKKLLRKCQSNSFPSVVRTINTYGDRIFVGDVRESIHCVVYSVESNIFGTLAIDSIPRYITCACPLDYSTIVGGDKFGNLFVLRVPDDVDDIDFTSLSGPQTLWNTDKGRKVNRFKDVAQYYVGEVVTSVVKKPMVLGGADIIVYTTLMGAIGTLLPFSLSEDADFFTLFEIAMRRVVKTLSGWRHVAYRGYYAPVKQTIDGDLCELFVTLPKAEQKDIATTLDCSVDEILKKLEVQRNAAYF